MNRSILRWGFFIVFIVGPVLGLAGHTAGCLLPSSSEPVSRPAALPVPHVASDCRAACTLEGMELVGVELAEGEHQVTVGPRCLCAPMAQ